MTIEKQLERYLNNQINLEEENELPFTEFSTIEEDSIFFKVETNNGTYTFEYNCYFETVEGTCLYDFELMA